MKKLKIFSIISLVSNAIILTICLLVIFGYGYIWKNNGYMKSQGMNSLLSGWPVCIICALLSVLLIVLKSIFWAKGNKKLNLTILLLDIALYLLCGLLTILLMDNPLIDLFMAMMITYGFTVFLVIDFISHALIILLPILTLMTTLTFLSVVVDILIIILTKNIIIIKKKDEISNEQAL